MPSPNSQFPIPNSSVMVCGTFDLLHPGHVYFIEEARRMGEVIIVVAQDETVKQIKGRKPTETLRQRMTAIERRFPNDTVVAGSLSDFFSPLREHSPDILLLGYDQRLPPGITESDLPCNVVRAGAHFPEKFKSSLLSQS